MTAKTASMSPANAARKLDTTLNYVYMLLRVGRLRGSKIDGVWQVDPASVESYIATTRRLRVKRKQPF